MGRVKSDNAFLGILTGHNVRWVHSGVAETKTIAPHAGESVVLVSIEVSTTSASAITVRDAAVGVVGVLKASIAEGTYLRNKKLKGNLIVENPGGSDITINFVNY